jgi:hypothetical protein
LDRNVAASLALNSYCLEAAAVVDSWCLAMDLTGVHTLMMVVVVGVAAGSFVGCNRLAAIQQLTSLAQAFVAMAAAGGVFVLGGCDSVVGYSASGPVIGLIVVLA